jgi:hypothetical protein
MLESKTAASIQKDYFGAINAVNDKDAKDGIWLVKWTGNPRPLQEPTIVEGCGKFPMPPGTIVCEGFFYDRIDHETGWYEPPEDRPGKRATRYLFWVQQVLDGDVSVTSAKPSQGFVPHQNRISKHNRINKQKIVKLFDEILLGLRMEKEVREAFDMVLYEEEEDDEADDELLNDEMEDNEDDMED